MHRAAFVLPNYVEQELSEVDYFNGDFEEVNGHELDDENRCFFPSCCIQ